VLWQALARKAILVCSLCGEHTSASAMAEEVEVNPHTLAVTTIFCQLVRYGWASYDSVLNSMGGDADPSLLGGLFSGLQRAGLVVREPEPPPAVRVAAFISVSKPRPTYRPGPEFPYPRRKEHADANG
jgi:hypothetical protein